MERNLEGKSQHGDADAFHDLMIYKTHRDRLEQAYKDNAPKLLPHIQAIAEGLRDAGLTGQWSLDVMQSSNDFWLIDMALAHQSALKECVRQELKVPEENWLPGSIVIE